MKNLVNEYASDGLSVVKNLLPTKEVNQILSEIHSLVQLQLKRFIKPNKNTNNSLLADMELLLSNNAESYLATLRRAAKLVSITKLITHAKVMAIIEQLEIEIPTLSTEPVLHVISDKLKIPNGYYGIEAHQDWPSIQGSLDCMVVWIPLVEISIQNFPLLWIPKSHKNGLAAGKTQKNLYKIDESQLNSNEFAPIIASPGDVIFMSSWTIHKTGIANSTGFRLSISNRFENAKEETFINRNYPCAYQRSVNRNLITPNFPSPQLVKKLFEKLSS